MHRQPLVLLAALLLLPAAFAPQLAADTSPADTSARDRHEATAPRIRAARVTGSIRIDGALDEAAWATADAETTFTQLDPEEGKPVSERTEVRVLLGDDAIYVGARLFDREPGKIKARLARRDDPTQSDAFDVMIDSYHDHLTARHFRVTPAGAIADGLIGADGNEDGSWDAVWEANARLDATGWSCEFRIPLSQLRYNSQADAVWGIQFVRSIFRKGENAYFAFTPKKEQGGVNRYGHLVGLGRLPVPRRLELLPYATARNERLHFAPGDPFRSPDDVFGGVGGDVKYGLTSDLTLDLTLNPDFGQVEVDPAEVNLTAIETFYPEHRSFFVEGADLFAFGRSRAYNNFSVPTIFHSRRIGREPQRILQDPDTYRFEDRPAKTTIGGAAKVTGRTASGWSIGALDAVTLPEEARYLDPLDLRQETRIEPLTHYFAGRVRKDLRAGNTRIGALLTSANRDLEDDALRNLLRSDAVVGGLDLNHAWGNRTWAIDADVTASEVRGSASAINLTQRGSQRYFQRPDHEDYATYDPTRTSLSGYGADASISKLSGTHWLASEAYVTRSPGYEANDLGFETRADYHGLSHIVLYQENKPGRWFRNYTVFPYANEMWNYGGDRVFDAYAFDGNGQLANYWTFDTRYTLNRRVADDRLTRGGPQGQAPRTESAILSLGSDPRKSWSVGLDYTHTWNEFGGKSDSPSLSFSFRPSPTLRFRFEPEYSETHALGQFVTSKSDPQAVATYGRRYVFATLDQHVVSLTTRLDWTLTPKLSLQLYVQPLVVSADYSRFKEYRAPGTYEFDVYGKNRGSVRDSSGLYIVDPGNGLRIDFFNPNFNFRSLLGNAVVRWEYRPGSTLYFVWQQSRTEQQFLFGDFDFDRDYGQLFKNSPENVFAIKATWWIGL